MRTKRLLQIPVLFAIYLIVFMPLTLAQAPDSPQTPPAPGGLKTSEVTQTSVTLDWDTSPVNYNTYNIYRDNVNIANTTTVGYTDDNLTHSTTYYYAVSIVNTAGVEGPKSSSQATTASPDTTPPQITNVTLKDSSDTTAKIAWSTDDNSSSAIYYRTASGNKQSTTQGLVKSHEVTITSLEKGKSVYYTVSSCNADDYCSNSSQYSFMAGADYSPPAFSDVSIEKLKLVNGNYLYNNDKIDITGKTEGLATVTAYVEGVLKSTTKADENGTFALKNVALNAAKEINTVKLEAVDTAPSKNKGAKEYKLKIDMAKPVLSVNIPELISSKSFSLNGSISEDATISIYFIPVSDTRLSAPTDIKVLSVGFTGINLAWNKTNGSKYYYVYRDGNLIGRADRESFTDKEVDNSTTYTYSVSAVDEGCIEGARSAEKSVKADGVKKDKNPALNMCVLESEVSTPKPKGNFSIPISLKEGVQTLRVEANDSSGNTAVVEQKVTIDTEPPKFSNVKPSGSDRYYRDSLGDVDVKGKTTPNATVSLWVLKSPEGSPDDTTKADAEGNFKFKSVSFALVGTSFFQLTTEGNLDPKLKQDLGLGAEELQTWFDKNRFYYLSAENNAGLKSTPQIYKFGAMDCGTGNFSWTIIMKPEYQSPQYLSVERLQEGTERLAFYFELSYVGQGSNPRVENVAVRSVRLDTAMQDSDRYALTNMISNRVDFNSQKISDQTKMKWYIVGRPPAIADLTKNYNFTSWKEILEGMNNELTLPVEIDISYTYDDINGNRSMRQEQKICREVAYAVDNTKLDMSKLPDWLLYDGVDFLNSSVKTMDDILKQAEPVIETVGYVCGGLIVVQTVVTIARRVSENFEIASGWVKGAPVNSKKECQDMIKAAKTIDARWINVFSNKDLEDCGYTSLASLWKAEGQVYTARRWACDRLFCPKAPSPWTASKNNYEEVKSQMAQVDDDSNSCREDLTMQGTTARIKPKCDLPEGKYKTNTGFLNGGECYMFDGAYWYAQKDPRGSYTLSYLMNMEGASKREFNQDTIKAVEVTPGNKELLFTGRPGTCVDACVSMGFREKPTNQRWPPSISITAPSKYPGIQPQFDYYALPTPSNLEYLYSPLDGKCQGTYDINSFKIDSTQKCIPDKLDLSKKPTYTKLVYKSSSSELMTLNDETAFVYNNALYDKSGSCIQKPDGYTNPCQEAKDDKGTIKNPSTQTDISKRYPAKDASGNQMDIITKKECRTNIAKARSGEEMGVTYGVNGDELEKYIYSYEQVTTNQGANQAGVDNDQLVTCCCWNEDTSVGTTSYYIYPKDTEWNYRYSKTGFIYKYNSSDGAKETESLLPGGYQSGQKVIKQKQTYHPNMYFQGRDQPAIIWNKDNFFYGNKTAFIDPKAQFTSTVQTACLTVLYKRIQQIRNILASIRDCLISVRASGDYSSQVCKELFSKYVCEVTNDLVQMMITGCGPGGIKVLDFPDDPTSQLSMLKNDLDGVYGGIDESINQLGQDYGETVQTELFEGGVSGVARKACMAAFGYDWDISINTLLDTAYQTDFASSVMPIPPPKMEFLYMNPRTGPVFEYRTGIYIMPGCDIEGYTAELICVTELESRAHKSHGISCMSPDDCPCLRVPGMSISPAHTIISGGKVVQSSVEQRAQGYVSDQDRYIYDHVRVKLTVDKTKHKNCLPPGYEDGVWYFPIADKTPLNVLGCSISAQNGQVNCASGLAQEFGFDEAYINNVDMPNEAYLGNTLSMTPYVTTKGNGLHCLQYKVYLGDPANNGRLIKGPQKIEIQSEYLNQPLSPVSLITIDQSILGTQNAGTLTSINGNGNTQGFSITTEVLESSGSQTYVITLKDKNNNGDFACADGDEYILPNGKTGILSGSCVIEDSGIKIRITKVTPNDKNSFIGKEIKLQYSLQVQSGSSNEAQVFVELQMQKPRDGASITCQDTTDLPTGTYQTYLKKKVMVYRTAPNTNGVACTPSLTLQITQACQCGSSGPCSAGSFCYDSNFDMKEECHGTADQQAVSQLASQFSPLLLRDPNSIDATSGNCAAGTCDIIKPNTNYQILISKPQNNFNYASQVKSIEYKRYDYATSADVTAEPISFSSAEPQSLYENKKYLLGTISCSNQDSDSCKLGRVYRIEIKIDTGAGTPLTIQKYIYAQPDGTTTTGNVALDGTCGPANEGKCKSVPDCPNIDNIISENSISDISKKCSESLVCCK